jgi:hypothetical protein
MDWLLITAIVLFALLLYLTYQNNAVIENMGTSPGTFVQLASNDPYLYLGRYPRSYWSDFDPYYDGVYPYYDDMYPYYDGYYYNGYGY